MPPVKKKQTISKVDPGIVNGYRSGLEGVIGEAIRRATSSEPIYEQYAIKFTRPQEYCTYLPDFVLPNGIFIETKGIFNTGDRKKMKIIKAQYPELDIRFVFSNARQKISKTSSTSYAMWSDQYGFPWANKWIPDSWYAEPVKDIPEHVIFKGKAK